MLKPSFDDAIFCWKVNRICVMRRETRCTVNPQKATKICYEHYWFPCERRTLHSFWYETHQASHDGLHFRNFHNQKVYPQLCGVNETPVCKVKLLDSGWQSLFLQKHEHKFWTWDYRAVNFPVETFTYDHGHTHPGKIHILAASCRLWSSVPFQNEWPP